VLRPGQELVWRRPPWDEPAGLPTLPGANFLQHTLLHQVRRYAPEAAALHRLGRWASGLVLFALSQSARADLARQLRAAPGNPGYPLHVAELTPKK